MARGLIDIEKEFEKMSNQINSLMSGFFNDTFDKPLIGKDSNEVDLKTPATDLVDNENEYVAHIEIPGVNKEDISLNVADGMLHVKAQHNYSNEDKEGSRIERYYSGFERSMSLPSNIDENNIKANYNNGLLEVHLPKNQVENKDNVKYIDIS